MADLVLPTYSESIQIDAPPAAVWELVTAMDRYGEWSNENDGGRWRRRADGERGTGELGDVFVGLNRRNGEEWKAPVEVVERDEHSRFGFITGTTEFPIALWRYVIDDDGNGGTRLTEQWEVLNGEFIIDMGGEGELERREERVRESVGLMLQAIKSAAESATE